MQGGTVAQDITSCAETVGCAWGRRSRVMGESLLARSDPADLQYPHLVLRVLPERRAAGRTPLEHNQVLTSPIQMPARRDYSPRNHTLRSWFGPVVAVRDGCNTTNQYGEFSHVGGRGARGGAQDTGSQRRPQSLSQTAASNWYNADRGRRRQVGGSFSSAVVGEVFEADNAIGVLEDLACLILLLGEGRRAMTVIDVGVV